MLYRPKVMCVCLTLSLLLGLCHSWGSSSDKVLLKDVSVITLRDNAMTTGRRSQPVPQLSLKGGSAVRSVEAPEVVQCYNRGHDGYDVQWECVANVPDGVRFGRVNVNCEGYSYPDDPYILKGSCGLEYSLELTGSHNSQYRGDRSNNYSKPSYSKSGSSFSTLFLLIAVGGVIYIVYSTCLAPQTGERTTGPNPPVYEERDTRPPPPRRNRLYPDIPPPDYPGTQASAPPPESEPPPAYGWAPGYTSGTSDSTSTNRGSRTHTIFDTPSQTQSQTRTQTNTSSTGNNQSGYGFWSGIAAGGFLGYLFGNNNRGGNYYNRNPYYGGHRSNSWWGNGWGSGYNSGYGSTHHTPRNSWFGGGGWGNGGGGWGSRGGWGSGGGGTRSTGGGSNRSSGFGGTTRR